VKEQRIADANDALKYVLAGLNGDLSPDHETELCYVLKTRFLLSRRDISVVTRLSEARVKTRLAQYKMLVAKGSIPTGVFDTLEGYEPLDEVRGEEVERQAQSLARKEGNLLLQADVWEERLVERIATHLPTDHDLSYIQLLWQEAKKCGERYTTQRNDEEVAMATQSDLHYCAETRNFNFKVARQANDTFMRKVIALTEIQRKNFHVPTLHYNGLGDSIQGTANYDNQRWDVDRAAIDQAEAATELHVSNIELGLVNYDEVFVNLMPGNHGKIQPKSPDPHHQNWETVIGRSLKWAFRDNPRVHFNITDEWYQVVEVLGNRFLLTHGHSIPGGGSLDGITNALRKWADILPPFDYAIMGHFHRLARLPLPKAHGSNKHRTLYLNGTAVLGDTFIEQYGASHTNLWWLLFVNPRRITAEYAVELYD